jgi:hypothetical protein
MQTLRNLVIMALIVAAFSLTNAYSQSFDASFWYSFKQHQNPTIAGWLTSPNIAGSPIGLDMRTGFDQSKTTSVLGTKTFQLGNNFYLLPGMGIMFGEYGGTLIQFDVAGSLGSLSIFTMSEYGAVFSAQPSFVYHYGETGIPLNGLVNLSVGEQFYADMGPHFRGVLSQNFEIGPALRFTLGNFYLKPWVTTSLSKSHGEVLRIGFGYAHKPSPVEIDFDK